MQQFDVVVVGGGPAGGQCARSLAKAGRNVLLVERHKSFDLNNFSSGGTPIETLAQYDLPDSVVGSFWRKFIVMTSNKTGFWEAEKPLGAVLDFGRLREFLANDVRAHHGQVWMNCRYVTHQHQDGHTQVTLKRGNEEITVETRVLVDATGPSRSVIYDKESQKPEFLTGVGIEYLIEVDDATYKRYAEALTFLLGYRWIPKGYSWVFPMEPNRLKVGAGIINAQHAVVKRMEPLKSYIQLLIDECLQTKHYKILDVHGSALKYSLGLQDVYFRDNVIAIGDAVSTVNFLGGEGIRHGMQGADMAAKHIQQYLDGKTSNFKAYQAEMHHVFLRTWKISERLGTRVYLQEYDELVDKVVTYLQPLTLKDVVDILFFYRFEKISKGLPRYLLRKITAWGARFMLYLKRSDRQTISS